MPQFQKYATYYDALYQDKDYNGECDFLEKIFKKYAKKSIYSILDLGCGTGNHDLILGRKGYQITGVDFSSRMIEIAKKKVKNKKIKTDFLQGNIQNINLKKKFDAVISMFAVISYQITNKDLISAFQIAKNHLKKGGLFIFDFWFGPAVLTEKPQQRFKIIKNGSKKIIRFAFPTLNPLKHTVSVKFEIIKLSKNKVLDEIKEIHTTRFFSPKEIKHYLQKSGFKVLKICPFGDLNGTPSVRDWNVTVVAKKL